MEKICVCKKEKCSRHGDCERCRAYHSEKNSLPACERDKDGAKLRAEIRAERKERRRNERILSKT